MLKKKNNTKKEGNQNVILADSGCQEDKIGLTNPNFFTCL